MGKLPYMRFFVNDFMADTRALSTSSTGIWIKALCDMHWHNPRGQMRGTRENICRACGCTLHEFENFLSENKVHKVANVTLRHEIVTLKSRRMAKEEKEREQARKRKAKERGHADVTDDSQNVTNTLSYSGSCSSSYNNSCSNNNDFSNLCQQWQEEIEMQPSPDTFRRLNRLLLWLAKEIATKGLDLKAPAEIISEEISLLATKYPGKQNIAYLEGTVHRKLEEQDGVAK